MVYIKNGGLESIMSIFYMWCKPSTAIINKKKYLIGCRKYKNWNIGFYITVYIEKWRN